MRQGEETWILKPSLTNQALAVTVFDRVADLYTALQAAPRLHEWVLQRCVAGGQQSSKVSTCCQPACQAIVHASILSQPDNLCQLNWEDAKHTSCWVEPASWTLVFHSTMKMLSLHTALQAKNANAYHTTTSVH